jgi:anaphase-promoting complex subunit 10
MHGVARGVYDFTEIMTWTNYSAHAVVGQSSEPGDSGDERLASSPNGLHGTPVVQSDEDSFGYGENEVVEMVPEDLDEDLGEGVVEERDEEETTPEEQANVPYFDPVSLGLKEINNLAHFGVSSHKPGNGVRELLSDDIDKYWQYESSLNSSMNTSNKVIS